MSKTSLDNIADKGTRESFKLDKISSHALHRVRAIYRHNCGLWIGKDYLVRRAIRFYLEHLQRSPENKAIELDRLTRAVEGRI